MSWRERRAFNSDISAGGLDLPTRIAAYDRELTPEEFVRVSRGNRHARTEKIGRATLGKALLIGVKGYYALPKTRFGVLERYVNRVTGKALGFLDALRKYRPDQSRDDHGRFADEGKGRGGGGSRLPKGSEASALYTRNTGGKVIDAHEFIRKLPQEQQDFLRESQRKLDAEFSRNGTTEDMYRAKNEDGTYGKWSTDRQRLHESIIRKFITEALEKDAYPDEGDPPTVVMMGGRGGAGKTSTIEKFLGVNPEKHPEFMYLNSDDIKGMLPEYVGYNASLVHEESSYIADQVERIARELGLNVIYDATLKSEGSAMKRAAEYAEQGYRIEAFFVHTTPETSASRATARAVRTGRYVTPSYILSSTSNERSFDAVKGKADAWILFDNNGKTAKKVASGGTSWLK